MGFAFLTRIQNRIRPSPNEVLEILIFLIPIAHIYRHLCAPNVRSFIRLDYLKRELFFACTIVEENLWLANGKQVSVVEKRNFFPCTTPTSMPIVDVQNAFSAPREQLLHLENYLLLNFQRWNESKRKKSFIIHDNRWLYNQPGLSNCFCWCDAGI